MINKKSSKEQEGHMKSYSHSLRTGAATVALMAAAVALTGPAAAQQPTTLKVVAHSALRVLDPILTTAYITRNHGYMVYDTLLAWDDKFKVTPQMAEKWEVSDDKLTYTFTLRDGLKWHDGKPVTTADIIPSIKRWGERDAMGQKLMDFVKEMTPVDDKTFKLVLKEPYGLVLDSLAKVSSNVPFMMPKRLAETKSTEQIPEQIGSGPFKFVQSEFQPGVKVVWAKNTDYVPRKEPAVWASGGKVAKVDRVEWVNIPDHMTAVNALINGEIDWIEAVPHDLLPIVESASNVKVEIQNPLGSQGMLRMNWLHPPFNNVKIRQAVMHAVAQEDYMKAQIGNKEYYQVCPAIFVCGTPLETDAGSAPAIKADLEKAKQLLKEGGYDGTPIVLMAPTDLAAIAAYPQVTLEAMKKIGMNVDYQAMDWQTLVGRRAKTEPPAQGGWNMFHTNWVSADILNPVMNSGVNGRGAKAGGWFGWSEDAEMEKMRDAFARETDPAKQKQIATDIQKRSYDQVFFVPLGQFTGPTAYRNNVKGILKSPAIHMWNIEKTKG